MTMHLRAVTPRPSTLDPEGRTIEAIVSTGADAPRPGFVERLDLRGADLTRLIGAPLLDAHRSGSTRDQLGVVEAAELRSEGIWVRLRFRSNDAARAVLADIGEGTLRGLSIGYTVAEWTESRDGNRRIRTATRWTPLEVSIVPVPADPGAHFRHGENQMPDDLQTTDTDMPRHTRAQANAEIRTIADTAGLTRAWADSQIDAEATPEEARAAAFEAMRTRTAQTTTRSTRAAIVFDHTDPAVIAERAGEALFARHHPEHQLSEPAGSYAGMSIPEIARDCLRRSGISTAGLSADTLVTRTLGHHATSDFPHILADFAHRELRAAYQAAPSGVHQLARQRTARDFRTQERIQLGEAPQLERVNEGGEFKFGTISDGKESYRLETVGKILAFTRQALVNDDLGAFSRIAASFGQAARDYEAQQLVRRIQGNPTMADGITVFNAGRSNVKAAETIKADLAAARRSMRGRTGLDGMLINATPRFVLVPPDLETEMEQALSEVQAARTDDVNPFSSLSLVVEPRLTAPATWFVVADPAIAEGLEYAYLEGAPGPQIETMMGFEVDGLAIKARLDFGCGWIDHRSWFRVG